MILDKIENIKRYSFLEKIDRFNIDHYKKGKIEIDGDVFFGIGLEYETKNQAECLWEAHKRYLDVHLILEGEEKVQVSNIETMNINQKYDQTNDYTLFDGDEEQEMILKKGMFLALYPNEVHKTAVITNKISNIKKIVFKLEL